MAAGLYLQNKGAMILIMQSLTGVVGWNEKNLNN